MPFAALFFPTAYSDTPLHIAWHGQFQNTAQLHRRMFLNAVEIMANSTCIALGTGVGRLEDLGQHADVQDLDENDHWTVQNKTETTRLLDPAIEAGVCLLL